MKKYFLISALYLFILPPVQAGSCDSIVVGVNRNFVYYSGSTTTITSSTYNDGLLRKYKNSYIETHYSYDSLRRVTEIINYRADTINSKTVQYYSSVTGNDTAVINFSYDGQNYFFAGGQFISYDIYQNVDSVVGVNYNTLSMQWDTVSGQFNFYDVNQNIQMFVTENYDTLLMQWDTTWYKMYFYSPDSLTRSDTTYSYPGNWEVEYGSTVWDSQGREIGSSYGGQMYWGGGTRSYDSLCSSGVSRANSWSNSAGPGSSVTRDYGYWYYDSLCRPVHVIDSSWNIPNNPTPSTLNLRITDYYYADCNTIVVAGPDTVVTCADQPVTLNLFAYGGTGPLSFLWTTPDSLSDHTVLNPIVYTDSGSICQLTVTDSLGNQAQFQMIVAVNHFTAAVTDATCDTCHNGSVNIIYPPPHPYYYLTVSPYAGSWNGTTLSGLLPGDYNICSRNGSCTYCDSVHVLSSVSVGEIGQKNFIHISPNPVTSSLNVEIDAGHSASSVSWILRSMEGRILNSNIENHAQFIIPVEVLAKGIYFLEISAGSRQIIKIIKD